MSRVRPSTIGALLVASALLTSAAAHAHRFEHPKTLRLGVREGRLLLAITYDVNPGREAQRARSLFDRDADGALDPREQAMVIDALERTCRLWLRVEVDGEAVTWTPRERRGHRLDRPADDDTTLGVALLYEAKLPDADEVRLTIRDRDKDVAKHVPLTVDLGPGWRIELASQGEWHPEARQLGLVTLGLERPLALVLRRSSPDAATPNAPPG